jgi:diguanylate cyclase (GGDEF)-like protein
VGGSPTFSRTAFLQIRVVQSRVGAVLLLLPTAIIGPTLLWDSGADRSLLVAIGSCFGFAAAGLLGSLLADRYRRNEFALQLELLVRYALTLLFSLIPWLSLGTPLGNATNLLVFFSLTIHTAVNFEFVGRRQRLLGPFVLGQLSYAVAFAAADEAAMAALTLLWASTSIPAYILRTHSEAATLSLVEGHRRSARVDTLTGLANRTALVEAVDAAFANDLHGHLVAFDLDKFKAVNDTFGHGVGDAVLMAVASRLRTSLPERSTIARLGGDEFVAWVPRSPAESENDTAHLVARVSQTLSLLGEAIEHGTHSVRTAASAGITVARPGDELEVLLNEADIAMYWSKGNSLDVTLFDEQMRVDSMKRVADEQRFREAMATEQFTFWGQPIINAKTHRASGVELLVRWPQADGSTLHAADFIHLVRDTGLEVELGRQALQAAADLLGIWAGDEELKHLEVNINLSPMHLGRGLLEDVNRIVRTLPKPSRLGLEFGEAELIDETREVFIELAQIRAAGPRILIDDFGVGYSSLTYLRTLPISGLKIDPSFVAQIQTDPTKQAVTSAIVHLASALDLTVTAEGVMQTAEFDCLRSLGVGTGQGNLFASSAPLEALERTLRSPFTNLTEIRRVA